MMPRLPIGCFPFSLHFCDGQKQFDREIRSLSDDGWKRRWVNAGANATAWRCTKKGFVSFIVSVDRSKMRSLPVSRVAGTLAHEATHVVDWLLKNIGEHKSHFLGSEFHAYQMGELVEWLVRHYYLKKH